MTSRDSSFAALTEVAEQETTSGGSPVQFNVAHAGVPPAGFGGISPPTSPDTLASESMRFQASGAGFGLYAWIPETPSSAAESIRAAHQPDRDPASHLYHGSVLIKPMFAHRPAQTTEVLVSLGHDPWSPDYRDSLMLVRACRELLSVAARHRLQVRYLHSPVSPFHDAPVGYKGDGSGEAPRVSNALAVRMGLAKETAAQRLATLVELTNLAKECGFGFDVSDQRLGRGKGQWWTVLPADPATYRRRKHELFDWAPTEAPRSVLLCTAIGPGRLGSTTAIAVDLAARAVGIVAISAIKLHGITFVNLMIPVAPGQSSSTPVGLVAPISAGLDLVAARCGLTGPGAVPTDSRIAAGAAADCRLLTSGPFPLPSAARESDRPLWTSWTLPVDVFADQKLHPDLAELVLGQLARETAIVTGARIDYQRTRISPDRRLSSRAKITISLPPAIEPRQVPAALTELCTRVRREAVTTLVQQGIPVRGFEITLDWRERWVGQGPG